MAKAAASKATKAKSAVTVKPTVKKPTLASSKKTKAKSTGASSSSAANKAAPPTHIPIPEGWPVSSQPTTASNYNDTTLTPGNLLRTNCNGSDVFLRKRATQPAASLSLPSSAKTKGPARFLVVFPGRLSLKPPEKKAASKQDANEDDDILLDEAADNDETTTKRKSPFAPSNPPHLLGTLREGPNHQMQLSIPFSSTDDKQLVFSGRAIPVDGKFMTLSFKRTGGKGDPKKKGKTGTGSVTCKDVFRSVIVLGESKVLGDYRHIKIDREEDAANEANVMHHYGGSDRTVDGGGQGVAGVGSRMSVGGKRDSSSSVKSLIAAKRSESGSESNSDILDPSDGEENDSDADSDGEFMPTGKKRKNGKIKDTPNATEPKRASRRSVSKDMNVSYVDENSDVDLDDEDSNESENDKHPSESEDDEFDELLDNLSKKPPGKSKPKANEGRRTSSASTAASSTKVSYVEIDSDEDDDDDVIIMDSNSSAATTKTSNKPAISKTIKIATKPATMNGASAKAPTKKAVMSSPPKSPISPRRRKKAAPRKSSSFDVMDLSDDSFSFL